MSRTCAALATLAITVVAGLPAELDCQVAVVGGGWAGVYAAWRLAVDTRSVPPQSVCVFEGTHRFGGRTYSVNRTRHPLLGPLVVDIGAYRYSKQQHLPGDLIAHLGLRSECYEPDCRLDKDFNTTLYKLVDANGNNAGYVSAVQEMIRQLAAAGAKLLLNHRLTALGPDPNQPGGLMLQFDNNQTARARQVVLNLPREALRKLPDSEVFDSFEETSGRLLRDPACLPLPASNWSGYTLLKAYAVYQQPWWRTILQIKDGYFNDDTNVAPFSGRYHDGPIHKAPNGTVIGPGALELVYSNSPLNVYYHRFREDSHEPLSISQHPQLLADVHSHLMRIHQANFSARGLNASSIAPPTSVVFGFWTEDSSAMLTAPISNNIVAQLHTGVQEQCIAGLSPHQYSAATRVPSGKYALTVANNDWYYTMYQGTPCCWAEQSLKQVENSLHSQFKLDRPAWLDSEYYSKVLSL